MCSSRPGKKGLQCRVFRLTAGRAGPLCQPSGARDRAPRKRAALEAASILIQIYVSRFCDQRCFHGGTGPVGGALREGALADSPDLRIKPRFAAGTLPGPA